MDTIALPSALLLIALVAAAALTPVAPEAGNIIFLGMAGLGLLFLRPADRALLRRPVVWMPLLGTVLVALAYGLSTQTVEGALIALAVFSPMIAVAPLLALGRRTAPLDPVLLALLSFAGVLGAAAVALVDYTAGGMARAGESVANPIHFADVALAAGFLATLGTVYAKGWWRALFLLGPVLATVAALLSGTRGAVVALAAMVLVAIILVVVLRQVTRRVLLVGAVALVALSGIALLGGAMQTTAMQRVLADIASVQSNGLPTDSSSAMRLQMYQGAIRAFQASPLVGHGPHDYVAAAEREAGVSFDGLPHLHNDLADFAASGGVLGLLAYFLFLLAPLVEVLRAPRSPQGRGLLTVVASLTAGYAVMGLTNAMFGILTVTVYFSLLAVVVGLVTRADN